MARIRTIKPEFFTSEDIVSRTPLARLFFQALWCEADREGRLEWKLRTFKLRYFPGDDCDIESMAKELIDGGLVTVYEVDGKQYAEIPTFKKHQVINNREAESEIPVRVNDQKHASGTHESGVKAERKGKEGKGTEGKGTIPPQPPRGGEQAPDEAKPINADDLKAEGVDAQVATEFLALRKRKRATLTELALEGIRREAGRAGLTLDATLRKCIERGWQGFEASWVEKGQTGAPKHGNFANQDYRAGLAADGSF
jgi:hypothetical protein